MSSLSSKLRLRSASSSSSSATCRPCTARSRGARSRSRSLQPAHARPLPPERLSDADSARLYSAVEEAVSRPVGREEARKRLTELREVYEPKAQGLADWLALDLPPWLRQEDKEELMRLPGVRVGSYGRDLVGEAARPKGPERHRLQDPA